MNVCCYKSSSSIMVSQYYTYTHTCTPLQALRTSLFSPNSPPYVTVSYLLSLLFTYRYVHLNVLIVTIHRVWEVYTSIGNLLHVSGKWLCRCHSWQFWMMWTYLLRHEPCVLGKVAERFANFTVNHLKTIVDDKSNWNKKFLLFLNRIFSDLYSKLMRIF